MRNRVYISCGGTGGHFFPGLSLARELQKREVRVRLLLSGVNAPVQSRQAAEFGIDAALLPRMPSPGKNPLRLLLFLLGLAGGFFKCCFLFLFRRPDCVILMGSFASAPAALAALLLFIPVFLHDGNARIGKANRLLSRFARFIGTAFPAVNPEKCRCPVIHTGMPLRPELLEHRKITQDEARRGLNKKYGAALDPALYTILIFGGSQGAATINHTLSRVLKQFEKNAFQVLHLTGKGKLEETAELYGNVSFPLLLLESASDMELFLGSADLVFARSGGSTVAELASFRKYAVLIPYPYAAEDHQSDNARFYAGTGAAEMVRDDEFTVGRASEILKFHLENPQAAREGRCKAAAADIEDAAGDFLRKTGIFPAEK